MREKAGEVKVPPPLVFKTKNFLPIKFFIFVVVIVVAVQ